MSSKRWVNRIAKRIAPMPILLATATFLAITALLIATHRFGDMSPVQQVARSLMVGFDIGVVTFLGLIRRLSGHFSAEEMARHAKDNDVNRTAMLVIGAGVSSIVLLAVTIELANHDGRNIALAIATMLLAWLFANILFALHYTHLYWRGEPGGLTFSGNEKGTQPPDYMDFLYFTLSLGMTFQTSDTGIATRELRRVATVHTLLAFLFNMLILALSINIAAGAIGGG